DTGPFGLSPRKARLLGISATLVAAVCGVWFVRQRVRQRQQRVSAKQRLQDQLYLSVSRLISAGMFTVGPLHDHHGPALNRLGPLLVEAILRRKTGATPLLVSRASQALPTKKRR